MTIVLDTNVIIAGIAADGLCRDLLRRGMLPHDVVTSEPLLEELAEKLTSKFRVDPQDVPFLAAYRKRAEAVVPAALDDTVCRDPDDDVVLGTALAGKADIILTGDEDPLVLKSYRGIRILSPRQYLAAQPATW